MNPQTETIADLVRKRQRYLAQAARTKLILWTLQILTVTLMLCALTAIVLLPVLIAKLAPDFASSVQAEPNRFLLLPATDVLLALCVVGLILAADKQKDRIATLPVVPPVSEQIAALPDSLKLVRASQAPPVPADQLLRAVTTAENTPTAELLRACQERTGR